MPATVKDRLETVLDRVRAWPLTRQEDAIRTLLAMESEGAPLYQRSDEERADIKAGLEEIIRGEEALMKMSPPPLPATAE